MDLNAQGNTDTKIKSIVSSLRNLKNKNVEKIILSLNDSSNALVHFNDKVVYINFQEGILKQLIFNYLNFLEIKNI